MKIKKAPPKSTRGEANFAVPPCIQAKAYLINGDKGANPSCLRQSLRSPLRGGLHKATGGAHFQPMMRGLFRRGAPCAVPFQAFTFFSYDNIIYPLFNNCNNKSENKMHKLRTNSIGKSDKNSYQLATVLLYLERYPLGLAGDSRIARQNSKLIFLPLHASVLQFFLFLWYTMEMACYKISLTNSMMLQFFSMMLQFFQKGTPETYDTKKDEAAQKVLKAEEN